MRSGFGPPVSMHLHSLTMLTHESHRNHVVKMAGDSMCSSMDVCSPLFLCQLFSVLFQECQKPVDADGRYSQGHIDRYKDGRYRKKKRNQNTAIKKVSNPSEIVA